MSTPAQLAQLHAERLHLLRKWERNPDLVEATAVAAALLAETWQRSFDRFAPLASDSVIRAVLEQVGLQRVKDPRAVLLVELMRTSPVADLRERWARALETKGELESLHYLHTEERRSRARVLIRDPLVLQAIQAAAVSHEGMWLEVLAADGSAASVEALMPSVLRLQREGGSRLRRMERMLSFGAPTPEMRTMLASIRDRRTQNDAASPALAFAHSLGLEVDRIVMSVFFFSAGFRTTGRASDAFCQGQVHIDSTRPGWLSVFVSVSRGHRTEGTTSFDNGVTLHDHLGLGRCDAYELPIWLARAQRELDTRWEDREVSGSLRGRRRTQFIDWLFAPSGVK